MKIGFKPQTLVKNLATEVFSDNGNTLNRIIEIPATATAVAAIHTGKNHDEAIAAHERRKNDK